MAATKESFLLNSGKPKGVFISFRGMKFSLLAAFLLILAVVVFHILRGTPLQRGNAALVKAFSSRRLIEPRLSGGFKAAVFNPTKNDETDIKKDYLDEATTLIQDAVSKNDPISQLSYGRLLVSKGNSNTEALRNLQLAVKNLPASAESNNDLGVCLMERGRLEDAIDKFNIALKEKPDMPEALFNRALCYEHLLLRDAASEEYANLIPIEKDPGWAQEARQRQEEMATPILPKKHEKNAVALWETAWADGNLNDVASIASGNIEILVQHAARKWALDYLNQTLNGDHEAARNTLDKMEWIAARLVDSYGDTSNVELVNHVRNLPAKDMQEEIRLINEFYEAESFIRKEALKAFPIYSRLSRQFGDRKNYLFQFQAAFCASSCVYTTGQYSTALEELELPLAMAEKKGWAYRRALILMQMGTIHSRIGNDSLCLKYCGEVKEFFRNLPLVQATRLRIMAGAYTNLGDIKTGLDSFRESNRLFLGNAATFSDLASNYSSIANSLNRLGNHSLALQFGKQALVFSQNENSERNLSTVESFIALEYAQLGQFDQAEEELKKAFDNLEKIEEAQRGFPKGLVFRRAGELSAKKGDTARALQFYSEAEAVIEQNEEKLIPMMNLLRARSETYVRAGDSAEANQNLKRAIGYIEEYRANISERKNRSDFFDASLDIFDQMILLNIRAFDNKPEAFNLSEQSRARTLLDDLGSAKNISRQKASAGSASEQTADYLTLSQVQEALPDDVRLITYSVTKQGTFIFLVTRSNLEVAESPASAEALVQSVQDYLSSLKSKAALEEVSEKSRALYRLLIEPIEARLRDGKRLCIVPDKALHFLPFAPLMDSSGKYFVQSHRLSYAPSASMLVRCMAEARQKSSIDSERILAVGNPLFNQDDFPKLARLPDAEREAYESAAVYNSSSVVLRGPEATKAQVIKYLADSEVVHLSLHCLVEDKSPWLAALVLANSGAASQLSADRGLLYLSDVYGMSLPRTRLVVLSACQSGLGQYYKGEGIVSLVRPFLALKVPTVVASLWAVDSEATAALMIDFHRQRKKNSWGADEALRDAQVRMAGNPLYKHPYYWAPFISVGSSN